MSHVTVYSKTTGEKQRVPEKWLDHPVLGKDFEVAPSRRAKPTPPDQLPDGKPDTSWTVKQLTKYAADHEIDLAGARAKDAVLAAINSTHESPSGGEEE